jgi:hypothetical protein
MAKKSTKKFNKGPFGIVSLSQLSKKSGISYRRLYENINEVYESLTYDEKTILANTLMQETMDLYTSLGFHQKITRIKGPTQASS